MARRKNDATDGERGSETTGDAPDGIERPITPDSDPEAGAEATADERERLDELDSALTEAETREPALGDPDDGISPAPGDGDGTAARAEDSAPEPSAEPEPHEETVEEESHQSFAARALTWLVLLLAGAGIGIWAAPKIAPVLPSGMAPVAAWLSPGQSQSESRIADLESRLETGLGDVTTRIADLAPSDDVAARVQSAVETAGAEIRSSLGAEIEDLRARLGEIDGAETRQRLARLEDAAEARAAEVESLKSQFAGADATADLTDEAVARIDTWQAEVEGLRAALSSQSDRVSGLAARIDEVASEADRQIETAQARVAEIETEAATRLTAATAQSESAQLSAALASGEPFADALSTLSADPTIEVPESLASAADQGVSTLLQLKESFPDAAHAAIRASIMASAGEGLLGRSNAYLRAQVASRSLTPQEGPSPDAILSRMEDDLRRDDLAGALTEADGLPSEAAAAMSGWLDEARRRLAAEQGLDALNSALPATN